MKINEIKVYQKKIDFTGLVIEKTEVRKVVSKLDDVEHKVCEALVGDETGTVLLTLWDQAIDLLEIGKVYSFTNLYSSEFKKFTRLNLGRFGEFKLVDSKMIVNKENKISKDSN